jgi:cytochrome c biogenesis protein CcmG/thiol:disulfide interchange protein DsbE
MSELAEPGLTEPAFPQAPVRKQWSGRRIVIFGVVSLINIGLLAFILTQLLTPASTSAPADPLVGHPAPAFSLTLLHLAGSQNTLSLADLKGKPVVLNFWASWCAPCKEEMPLLEQTWKQMQAQGKDVVFLGVDFQESSSDAAGFLQAHQISYQIGLDTDGAVAFKYDITALPQTVFINRQGTVASRIPGELTSRTLTSHLNQIVQGSARVNAAR